jgi:hypothetical protein
MAPHEFQPVRVGDYVPSLCGIFAPPKRTDDWIIIKLCVQARDHLTCLMRDVAFIGSLVSIS